MTRPRSPFGNATLLLAIAALTASSLILPATAAAADAPGTCAGATTTSARNTWLSGTISSPTDVDWYRFSIASGKRVQLTLGNLPADYDLGLYSSCSSLIASSLRSERQYDEVTISLAAGTYRVRVVGYNGATSATPYALRFRTLAAGIPILSSTTWTDAAGYLHVAGEVLNNTADHRRWIEIDASLRDAAGTVLKQAVGYAKLPTLAPAARAPFEIVTRKPSGYASTKLAVGPAQVTTAALAGLSISATASHLDTNGTRHSTGSVVNGRTSGVKLARAVVTLYDASGNVKGLGWGFSDPSAIPAGGSAPYDILGKGTQSPNRSVAVAFATTAGCSTTPRYTGARENLVPPLTRPSASNRVALTFDMGGRMTPALDILRLLVANHVCATIFPTGSISRTAEGQATLAFVKAHPEAFELGNHTMHHCDLVRGGGGAPGATDAAFCDTLAPSPTEVEVKRELIDGDAWVRTYAGMPTAPLWRAPYGVSNATVRTWAAEAGWTKHVKWDIDTIDWKPISDGGPTAQSMTLKVVNGATSGSIVLMHLGGYETLDALQSMIDGLRSRGFTLTTVSDLAQ
jgi:peptidoglycan/xylan/chitin deacetylase (PgdA/CDA1 family)